MQGRARLLRETIRGDLDRGSAADEAVKRSVDLLCTGYDRCLIQLRGTASESGAVLLQLYYGRCATVDESIISGRDTAVRAVTLGQDCGL